MTDQKTDRARAKGAAKSALAPVRFNGQPVLAPALLARTDARERLQAAQNALERAQRVASESEAEAALHADAARAAHQGHAAAVAAWIAGGCVGSRPERVDDPALAKAEQQARTEHAAVSQALASLQAARDQAQAELAAADEQVNSAVTDVILEDARRIADEIVELEQRAVELRCELLGIIGCSLVQRRFVATGRGVPYELARALNRPKETPNAGYFLPRYAEELTLNGGTVQLKLARQLWRERINELAGASIENTTISDPQEEAARLIAQAVSQGARF